MSWQLGVALALFFFLFNQWLFWGMEGLSRSRGETLMATRFAFASMASGAVVLVMNVCLWAVAQPKRWTDGLFALLAASVLGAAWVNLAVESGRLPLLAFSVLNLFVASWLGRGLPHRRVSKMREKR